MGYFKSKRPKSLWVTTYMCSVFKKKFSQNCFMLPSWPVLPWSKNQKFFLLSSEPKGDPSIMYFFVEYNKWCECLYNYSRSSIGTLRQYSSSSKSFLWQYCMSTDQIGFSIWQKCVQIHTKYIVLKEFSFRSRDGFFHYLLINCRTKVIITQFCKVINEWQSYVCKMAWKRLRDSKINSKSQTMTASVV